MISLMVVCAALAWGMPEEGSAAGGAKRAYEAEKSAAGRDAGSQVGLALWCEAHGLQAERIKHLAIAVLTDPSNATARGLLGMVQYHGKWARPDDVAGQVKVDPALAATLAEYYAKRGALKDNADAHYALALWCLAHGLGPEATAHFRFTVRRDPSREAAWKHLGYRKYNGVWMSTAQHDAAQAERDAQLRADRRWKPVLEKYRNWLGDRNPSRRADAEAKLAQVVDPRAVPSVWAVFATGDSVMQKVAVEVLGRIDGPLASKSLVLLAIRGGSADIRRSAHETLRTRDPRDFIDGLIDLLRKPLRYEVKSVAGPGSPGILFVEGERYNVRRIYRQFANAPLPVPDRLFAAGMPYDPAAAQAASMTLPMPSPVVVRPGATTATGRANAAVAESTQAALRRDALIAQTVEFDRRVAIIENAAAQQRLEADVATIEALNGEIAPTNDRVTAILKEVTEQDLGTDSASWKRWWTDQKGYAYITPDETPKPTYEVILPIVSPLRAERHSCFAAGTSVRTLDGMKPIESVQVGDRVVVQDTKTGRLGYEPIVAVYHNPPNATVRVTVDDESIVATGIHRFWRASKGWTMARDLKPGDTIRTLGGTTRVVSVGPAKVQPVFNLEVADGRTFFVGQSGLLVHDNTLVESTPDPFDAPVARASSE